MARQRNCSKKFADHFKKNYSKVRCIIDCSEIFIERPTSMQARVKTFSNYKKKHNTVKFLIAITPSGTISFVSKCWGGRVSDKELTQQSGFLDKLEPTDEVMADQGFLIAEEVALRRAKLIIPAFTKGKQQLSCTEGSRIYKTNSKCAYSCGAYYWTLEEQIFHCAI